MLVDNRFKKAINDAFYDKPFTVSPRTHGKDAEGGATTTTGASVQYLGNVQYSLNARSREAYGLTDHIDLAITADRSTVVKKDDEITYNGDKFVVSDVKPRDSHVLIIGLKR